MDIGSAFTFVFDDKDWIKKIAIGGLAILLQIVIVPIFLVFGYTLQTIKNVRDDLPNPLPEWDNLGEMIVKGLMAFLIYLVYLIPAYFFICALVVANIGLETATDSDAAAALVPVVACLYCLVFVFSFIAAALFPAGLIRYAQYDTFGSAFQFGAIFNFIKNNIGDYVIVLLLSLGVQMIAGLGTILCLIGVVFTTFWAYLVMGHLIGQLARKAQPV